MKVSWALSGMDGLEGFVNEALECERSGLDGAWMPDYEAPNSQWPELYTVLTSLASRTRRLVLGSLVTDVLRRHPMVTAHAFATLSYLAPGRLILGVGGGAGTSHFPYGIPVSRPCSRLREGIKVIRLLWSGRRVSFNGKHFRLKDAIGPLRPKAEIPIYIASYGPKMLELTAEEADGWIPEAHSPETYRATLNKLLGMCDRELEPCLGAIFYPFEPDENSYRRLLRAAKVYIASYPDIAKAMGLEHPGFRVQHLALDKGLWNELADSVPDEKADETIIYGPLESCIERLARFEEAGCRHIILEPYWIEDKRKKEAIRLAGKIKAALG